MEKEKILIYPYDINACPILRHKNILEKYDITSVISPSGWGFENKDAGFVDGGNNIGMNVHSNFKEALQLCDTVLFSRPHTKIDIEKTIYPKVMIAIEEKKNIICNIQIDDDKLMEIVEICNKRGVYFKYLKSYNNILLQKDVEELLISKELLKIKVPVIFVLGISERTNKFELQLSLREYMITMGYKVSQVGSRNYCELLDFHSFPEFMFSASIHEDEKVFMFNRYIKKIEEQENPDVIIVGIPGGIMPFDEINSNGFGLLLYEVAQAVKPDAAILSLLHDDYRQSDFEMYINLVKYRFGIELDCFNISPVQPDWIALVTMRQLSFVNLNCKFIDNKIQNSYRADIPIYDVFNTKYFNNMCSFIIEKLTKYADIQYV